MFRKLLLRFKNLPPTPLGRWRRTEEHINNIKIDWANVDHCGTCAYKNTEIKDKKKPIKVEQEPSWSEYKP